MLDTIESTTEKPAAAPPLVKLPTKRELIEDALRTDPQKSDRAIAKAIGVDHKTVGAARARLGIASPLGNSPVTSPGTDISLAGATDKATAMINALAKPKPRFNPFDPKEECLVAAERLGVAVFVNPRNCVVIANGNVLHGIDEIVQVSFSDLPALIAKLQQLHGEYLKGMWTPDPDPAVDDDGGE
jgi:hypothetical protein